MSRAVPRHRVKFDARMAPALIILNIGAIRADLVPVDVYLLLILPDSSMADPTQSLRGHTDGAPANPALLPLGTH